MKQLKYIFLVLFLIACSQSNETNTTMCESSASAYYNSHKFTAIEEFNFKKLSLKGDTMAMYILFEYYTMTGEGIPSEITALQYRLAQNGDIVFQEMQINEFIDNKKKQNELIKQWHLEDIYKIYDKKSIVPIENKAKKGDLVAIYIFKNYYHKIDNDEKYIYWLKKLAHQNMPSCLVP